MARKAKANRQTRYTDDFRAGAVLMLEAAGYPDAKGALTKVAKHLKVPASTLRRWFHALNNPPPAKLVNEKRLDLATKFESIAHLFIDEAVKDVEENGVDGVRAMTAAGIAVDKMRLLREQSTAIVKLERAIKAGQIKPEQVKERWPHLADKFFNEAVNVDA